MIHFDLPKEQSSIIKVIGVGGGGSNAVNHMFSQNIEGVNFIICNTDAQAIAQSKVPNKIQLGPHLTQGLGAGANPEIGRQATEESLEEIKRILEVNTKMAFITAGMGGGTGTGGAPILAKVCKDLGILTVGIVTTPFGYEGKRRFSQAEDGIDELKKNVDTLLVISNDKLRHQFGNLKMKEAFAKADNVLATAAKCITDVINSTGQINVDFADVCTVMRNGGVAILGSASATGENRAFEAIENALNSPLLNDNDIRGARWILININSAEGEHEFTMDEVDVIQNYLLSQAGEDTDVILGMGYDNTLGDSIGVTLIATGFEHKDPFHKKEDENAKSGEEKIVVELKVDTEEPVKKETPPAVQLEIPVEDVTPTLFPPEEKAVKEEKIVLQMEIPEKPVQEPVVEIPSNNTVDKKDVVEFQFEITSPAEKNNVPVTQAQVHPDPTPTPKTENAVSNSAEQIKEASNKSTLSSEGFLVRPSQIYVEDKPSEQSNPKEESQPQQESLQDDEPVFELQLVVKNSQ
ncbi:MAG TPA: cell division protein FtsZ, partial [Ferruginibacter sp.]|nr:cell division protein FtsZ [Ferruginibacter sp.]